jgi:hypothetical protein
MRASRGSIRCTMSHQPVRWFRALVALAAAGLGCQQVIGQAVPDDPVTARGLRHTSEARQLVEQAIESTNLLVGATGPRLAASWLGDERGQSGPAAAPVYLVEAPPGGAGTPAAVPRNCVCVFVNPGVFDAWVTAHSTGSGRLDLDRRYVLVFMLLHEVGHLKKRSAGVDFVNGEVSQLNIEPSFAKRDEDEADEFAADLVRRHTMPPFDIDRQVPASWVSVNLTKLSWNMQAYRSLDEFGAFLTGKPAVYFDPNLSHPNLGWRVLRTNYLIQRTPEAKALLDDFEALRQKGANPQPLYQRRQ